LKATLCSLYFMMHKYIMLLPEMVFDSTQMLQSCSCHVIQYIHNTALVCIINFHHTLIIYKNFIILCLVHFNVYCNFTCKYVLTSRILHLVHILLTLLWICISHTPWRWPFETWNMSEYIGDNKVVLIIKDAFVTFYVKWWYRCVEMNTIKWSLQYFRLSCFSFMLARKWH
jgi:hypothetical protein